MRVPSTTPPDVVLDHATTLPLPPPIDAAPLPQLLVPLSLSLLVSASSVLPETASASSGQPAASLTVVQLFINAAMEDVTIYRNLIHNLHQQKYSRHARNGGSYDGILPQRQPVR